MQKKQQLKKIEQLVAEEVEQVEVTVEDILNAINSLPVELHLEDVD